MITESIVKKTLAKAGIGMSGENPWDLQVRNKKLYPDLIARGSLALGEGYMNDWWNSDDIAGLVHRLWTGGVGKKSWIGKPAHLACLAKGFFSDPCSKIRSGEIGEKHYDIGNKLYAKMLGKYMVYSCGYWPSGVAKLADSQFAKMDLVCRKLRTKPRMTVLDIGCGWGETAKFAAQNYGVHVVGVTVSKEQKKIAEQKCKGLPVKIELMDYRDISKKYAPFDRIFSIGMLEHVGWKHYRKFMKTAHSLLKPKGIFLLHTIGSGKDMIANDPWIEKYIFPGAILPSERRLNESFEGLFQVRDWHSFGQDYDKTLVAWNANFKKSWPIFKAEYGERFYRMWKFYLLSCAGSFRAGNTDLWQIVLTDKNRFPFEGYVPAR